MLVDRPRILLAEDDPITREVIATHLSSLGCDVVKVSRAVDALAIARRERIDGIILDCHLGDDCAHEVLRRLLEIPQLSPDRVPRIAISAELDDRQVEALLAAGCSDALEKPVSAQRLRRALQLSGIRIGTASAPADGPALPGGCGPIVLDDARGLESCGSADVLKGLRQLLLAELPRIFEEIDAAIDRRDVIAHRDVLHRMKSALAFCGATSLLEQINAFDAAVLPDNAQRAQWQAHGDALVLALIDQERPGRVAAPLSSAAEATAQAPARHPVAGRQDDAG